MPESLLEQIGLTQEEIQDRLVNQLAEEFFVREPDLENYIRNKIEESSEKRLQEMFNEHIAPDITQFISDLTLQRTNEWGEAKGKPVTFVEYLVQRADAYLKEPVNYRGETKAESRMSWSNAGSRVTYLIDKHLQYSIESAMQDALKNLNESIAGGLETSVKAQLNKLAEKFKLKLK